MPIQFDTYTSNKIENLKNHLSTMAAKGQAKFYEIFVDALKAVPKTDEIKEFDGYEDYMTPDTEQIRILIYNSGLSPRNDQYVFVLKASTRDEANHMGLQGFPNKTFSKTSLSSWRDRQINQSIESKEFENAQLKKEISELRKELQESEEYAETLEQAIEEAKANSNKIGGIHWGEVIGVALEGIVRRNTKLIAQIPGGLGLAGLIEKDNTRGNTEEIQPEAEVSFKKKSTTTETKQTSDAPQLTEREKLFIRLMKKLEKHFSPEDMTHVMTVLDFFTKERDFLFEVLNEIESYGEESSEEESEKENGNTKK